MNQEQHIEFITDFFIVDIETTKFIIRDNASIKGVYIPDINYVTKFGLDFNFLYNIADEFLKIDFAIKLELFDENTKPLDVVADFNISVVFEVKNFAERLSCFVEKKDPNDNEVNLLIKLCNISFCTIRGLLIEKCNDTILDGFMLPFITDNTFEMIIRDR